MNDHASSRRFARDAGIQLAIFSVIITVSLLVGVLFDLLPLWQAILSLTISALACASISAFHARVSSLANKREAQDILEIFRTSLDDSVDTIEGLVPKPKFEWLWTNAQLARYEARCEAQRIWILSPDLGNDVDSGPFAKTLKKSIARGVHYTYFLPDSRVVRGRLPSLRQTFQDAPSLLETALIPSAQFEALPFTHVAAFFLSTGRRVFFEAPVEGRGFWIRCGKRSGDALVGQLASFQSANMPREEGTKVG